MDREIQATQPYGIVLEQNSLHNTVIGSSSGLHPQFDLFDGNTNCADNDWGRQIKGAFNEEHREVPDGKRGFVNRGIE